MRHSAEGVRNTIGHWWVSLIIGIIAVIVGIWSLATPLSALTALTTVFVITFFVSGIFEIDFAIRNRNVLHGWGWTLAGGVLDIGLGIMLLAMPSPITTKILIYFVGFWIMIHSLWSIGAAHELRRLGVRGWGWMLAMAILSLIFSLIFIFSPVAGGVFIVAFFGAALIVYGIFRIYMAMELRGVKRRLGLL